MQYRNIDEYLQHWLGEAPDPELCKPADYFRGRMEEFSRERNEEGCVVMLGDSITDFAGDWSVYLPGWKVVNRGIAGDMIEGMELRLDEVASLHPADVYILAGCNNFVKHPAASPEEIWPVYEHFLEEIKRVLLSVGIHLIGLLPMHPICPDYPGINAKTASFNLMISEAASRHGFDYIDLASALADDDGNLRREYTTDGCHLTDEGYAIWAGMMKNRHNK